MHHNADRTMTVPAHEHLTRQGFFHSTTHVDVESREIESFRGFWDRLPLDENFKSYTTRHRRILKYRYAHPDQFEIDRDAVYRPRAVYKIDYVQGENRLSYAEEEFIAHPLTKKLIRSDIEAVSPWLQQGKTYAFDLNLFRVKADDGVVSPTTSGIHRDGQDWIFMHFVSDENVSPVESAIYETEDPAHEVFRKPMQAFLETLVVNDRRMFHSADPVRQVDLSKRAFRDIIVAGLHEI
jgi:hypothetical protein